jgi:4-amino-4-deoxy-L-arabinose transferase-like glycosyltransferase
MHKAMAETYRANKGQIALFASVFIMLLATRLCQVHILWAEEGYGSAAAVQILHGKLLYRDFWFDKPPLSALIYVFWHGSPGFGLRFAGAAYAFACCLAVYRFAEGLWSRTEARTGFLLMAFFLAFDIPASVMTLGPDLLMVLPAIAALDSAARKQPLRSGLWCSVALAVNAKALLILVACAVWCWPEIGLLAAGFVAGSAPWFIWLAASGALAGYWQQVWWFGTEYSRHTFVLHPIREGLLRTLNWMGFHATLVLAAAYCLWFDRGTRTVRWAVWILVALAGVFAGERFFTRYYFILLPPLVLLGARGLALLSRPCRAALCALLLIPLIRFGPRYATLGADVIAGRQSRWADIALNQDSQRAAALVNSAKRPRDTLLVWGYRPDLFPYTRMPVAGHFLDSQLLTGVIADRHLVDSRPTFPELAAENRRKLIQEAPDWIVDGLGPLNPALAIGQFPQVRDWLDRDYVVFATTTSCVIYNRRVSVGMGTGVPQFPRFNPNR